VLRPAVNNGRPGTRRRCPDGAGAVMDGGSETEYLHGARFCRGWASSGAPPRRM